MTKDLERLLAQLGRAPLDRSLEGVAAAVDQRLAESAAVNTQTWRLRAAAIFLVAIAGAVAGTSTTAVAAANPSPFAAWSALAPSTLLEMND